MTNRTIASDPDHAGDAAFSARQPIVWITTIADQIAHEAGIARTADIEDLVILAYVGLLDSPNPKDLAQHRLLDRCRQQLVTWAWEEGQHDEVLPAPAHRSADDKRSWL